MTNPASPRPRLHRLYYVLAAFDVLTVCMGLVLINRITGIYAESVAVNAVWAERLAGFTDLNALAAEVNAPGNDVFVSLDLEGEGQRLAEARARFDTAIEGLRADLHDNVEPAEAATLLRELDDVEAAMDSMQAEARAIFDLLGAEERDLAGERMAVMDRNYADVTRTVQGLVRHVQRLQAANFAEQAAATRSLRRFEFVIAGLILLMVTAVTFYGRSLARRMKEVMGERERYLGELERYRGDLEQLVDERTSELRTSNEQLRLAERMASIGTLAAGLGHDMNNVLFPVRCRLDTLDQSSLDDGPQAEVSAIRQSLEYLQQLSDGLKLLALDPDDVDATDEQTELASWWDEVRPLFLTALPARATLEGAIDGDLPPAAVAPHRLTQALFNLVVNAGEAIADSGRVRVWARRADDNGHLEIGVRDTGHGMTAETRRRAMEPFYTTKTRRFSTGLGLALVHRVVAGAGGTIDIDSTPGEGTTITLQLPLACAREAAPLATRRVAVVGGDARVASLLGPLLASAGIQPALSPEAAQVLIMDAADATSAAAGAFLAADPRHRIIALDAVPQTTYPDGVMPIMNPPNLERVREVIDALWDEDTA